ncbi:MULTISPECIES: high-potential iron-sulfur protein [Burkholderia]|uniref:high-potential iron-sulfur protein n=1 Tax=Burkholderia TaxID=32008 RepID=UPI00159284FB|nr:MULTISPECIES: high-potential iron-sulfur protein [Burkholderia]
MNRSRRSFVIAVAGTVSALALASTARAEAPMLDENDPAAKGLGYRANATNVERVKYPRYQAGQDCGNCSFYQGKQTDTEAACPLFAVKRVSGKGWCSAYNKRA